MKSFNNDIEYYVINVKKWGTIYTKSQLSYFRICLDEAVKMDWIEKNPISHNIKIDKTESKVQEPLTKEEFENLKNTDLSQNESLQRIRDIFVFQCYSGLAYVDVKNLKYSDIQKDGDTFFIIKGRQKTATKFIIPLITGAMGIIDRYRNDSHRKTHYKDFVFPVKSNAKTNSYLKVIADLAGIPKNLTTHIARYTCNQLLYEAGVSDELRKQILGHSAITMTAHYTKSRVNILRDAINKIGD
jgi:integrase